MSYKSYENLYHLADFNKKRQGIHDKISSTCITNVFLSGIDISLTYWSSKTSSPLIVSGVNGVSSHS